MEVEQYLNKHFAGNKADFARAFGRQPQNVSKIFNNPDKWRVIADEDGNDYLVELKARRVSLEYRVHYTDSSGEERYWDVCAETMGEIRKKVSTHIAQEGGVHPYLQELNR